MAQGFKRMYYNRDANFAALANVFPDGPARLFKGYGIGRRQFQLLELHVQFLLRLTILISPLPIDVFHLAMTPVYYHRIRRSASMGNKQGKSSCG